MCRRDSPMGRPVRIDWKGAQLSRETLRTGLSSGGPSAPPGHLGGRAWKVPRAGGSDLGKTLLLKETEPFYRAWCSGGCDGGKERNKRLRAGVLQRQRVTKESELTRRAPRPDQVRKQDLIALGAGVESTPAPHKITCNCRSRKV